MVLVHLIIMVKFSEDILHVLEMCLPVHETARSSHWVGIPTVTLNACTTERKEALYVNKRRRGDFRILEKSGDKVRCDIVRAGMGNLYRGLGV
jgi:hypothetical protein